METTPATTNIAPRKKKYQFKCSIDQRVSASLIRVLWVLFWVLSIKLFQTISNYIAKAAFIGVKL